MSLRRLLEWPRLRGLSPVCVHYNNLSTSISPSNHFNSNLGCHGNRVCCHDKRQTRRICTGLLRCTRSPVVKAVHSIQALSPVASLLPSASHQLPSVRAVSSYHSEVEGDEQEEEDPNKAKVIKHHEKIVVGFAPSKIFDVVMDVGEYKHFVPYCKTSTVMSKECKANIKQGEDRVMMRAQLMVYFYGYKIPYTSDVTGYMRYNENQVKAVCYDQELFDHLEMNWTFSPGPTSDHCEMDFHISFAFTNPTLNWLAGYFKTKIIDQMIPAFMGRVETIHGKPIPLPCLSKLSDLKVEAGKKERHKRRQKR